MCYNNTVSGSTVFLDSGMSETFLLTEGESCDCIVYFSNGGLYSVSAVTVPGVAGCEADIDLLSSGEEWLEFLTVTCDDPLMEVDALNTTADDTVDVSLYTPDTFPAENTNYCLRFDVTPNAGI